ncbi:MAG: hypothetical protein QM765_01245 [Myxococcales bacterium]
MNPHLSTTALAWAIVASLISPSVKAQEAYLVPPPPPLTAPPTAQAKLDPKHLALDHSDAGLGVGEAFGAFGLQVAATGALTAITMVLMVATQANQSPNDRNALFVTAGVLAPPLLALPSSAVAYHSAKKACPRDRSFGFTYLAGIAGSALTVGAAALFVTRGWDSQQDYFPGGNELGLVGIALGGALVTAGIEVLALNLSGGTQVAAAPMVLKDGAGVAVGGSF